MRVVLDYGGVIVKHDPERDSDDTVDGLDSLPSVLERVAQGLTDS